MSKVFRPLSVVIFALILVAGSSALAQTQAQVNVTATATLTCNPGAVLTVNPAASPGLLNPAVSCTASSNKPYNITAVSDKADGKLQTSNAPINTLFSAAAFTAVGGVLTGLPITTGGAALWSGVAVGAANAHTLTMSQDVSYSDPVTIGVDYYKISLTFTLAQI